MNSSQAGRIAQVCSHFVSREGGRGARGGASLWRPIVLPCSCSFFFLVAGSLHIPVEICGISLRDTTTASACFRSIRRRKPDRVVSCASPRVVAVAGALNGRNTIMVRREGRAGRGETTARRGLYGEQAFLLNQCCLRSFSSLLLPAGGDLVES